MSKRNTNYFSYGDLVDIYHLARLKGMKFIFKNLSFSKKGRTTSKWNRFECSDTDFWAIPEISKRWNYKCTADPDKEYEDYVVENYLKGKSGLKLLSVGCGNSSHEQTFSKHTCFDSVEGIDISEAQLVKARGYAAADNCKTVTYRVCDFETELLKKENYDVILFHSSLHHFKNIENLIKERILPILKQKGLLVLFDYTGPNRLQWTDEQLGKCNELLKTILPERRTWYNSKIKKQKIFRPGLFRMWVSDPSEALDSELILDMLHKHFDVLEEKKLGCNFVHPLLKGISHHFSDSSKETVALLERFFKEEDDYIKENKSDFTFGVYRKK